jgi:hypothetical protein
MVKLAVDFEHPSRSWWENGGQALWDGISDGFEGSSVVLDASVAASWLAEASRVPGWGDGPEYAPHPIRASQADEEDLDL